MEEKDKNEEVSEAKLRKLKNLKMFKNMSDDEIKEYLRNRDPKAPKPPKPVVNEPETPETVEFDQAEYNKKYKSYIKKYLTEYGVDMNDANDAEALRALVRLTIQLEFADENIIKLQRTKSFDSRTLKNVGDFQRSVQMSITELQDRLGISRKARKEKQVDDIPQYIRELQLKAKDLWNRTTTPVRCPKCDIELSRLWINFPDLNNVVRMELECEMCKEKVIFST